MVRLRTSVTPGRGLRGLVNLPLIVGGLAIICAAVPVMSLSSLTVLSTALRLSDLHAAQFKLPGLQPLPQGDLRNVVIAGLAAAREGSQQDDQSTSFESRFPSAQSFLRSDRRNGTTSGRADVPRGPQGVQFASLELRVPDMQALPRNDLRSGAPPVSPVSTRVSKAFNSSGLTHRPWLRWRLLSSA